MQIKKYLFQLHQYQNQYNFFLYKRCSFGVSPYIIKLYINFLLMLKAMITKQNFWIDYFQKKIQKRLFIHRRLYINLRKWDLLEIRYKKKIKKIQRLADQREDNLMCLNIYNFLLK